MTLTAAILLAALLFVHALGDFSPLATARMLKMCSWRTTTQRIRLAGSSSGSNRTSGADRRCVA